MGETLDLPSYETSLRLIALRNVLAKEPPNDYRIRTIHRWYSTHFHTPLHVVDTLPRHDVLIAYYETVYGEMNEDPKREGEVNDEIASLINPPDVNEAEAERVKEYLFLKTIEESEKNKKLEPLKTKPVITPIDLDDGGPVSMTFADINKLDELEDKTEPLVGLK